MKRIEEVVVNAYMHPADDTLWAKIRLSAARRIADELMETLAASALPHKCESIDRFTAQKEEFRIHMKRSA